MLDYYKEISEVISKLDKICSNLFKLSELDTTWCYDADEIFENSRVPAYAAFSMNYDAILFNSRKLLDDKL